VLRVHQGKGGWLVAPAEGVSLEVTQGEADAAAAAPPESRPDSRPSEPGRATSSASAPAALRRDTPTPPTSPTPPTLGGNAEGISELHRIIAGTEIRKWPLYLRQVKQIVRAQNPPFDERAYGFASLVDLLRAAHKEGAFRVERDRQGVIRVFQAGSAGLVPAAPSPSTSDDVRADDSYGTDDGPEPQATATAAVAETPATDDAPTAAETQEVAAAPVKRPARKRATKSDKPKAAKPAAKKAARRTK
jgi:hypothetical protein